MNEGWSSAQVNEKLLDKREACDREVTPHSHFMKTLFSVFPCSFNHEVFSMQMTQNVIFVVQGYESDEVRENV